MKLVPNYHTNTNYLTALYDNTQRQSGLGYYLNFRQIAVYCSNEYIFPLKTVIQSLEDMVTLIGPTGCTPNVNCNCWASITRQRCGTAHPISGPPPFRNNVWEQNGCFQGTGGGQTESLQWFPTNPSSLSGSITQQLGSQYITSSIALSNELSYMANTSSCNTAQTVSNQLPNPATNTYPPAYFYSQLSQSGVALNSTKAATAIPNNVTLCGIDPVVMTQQSVTQGSPTTPYSFFQGMLIAMQTLLSQIGLEWDVLLNGSGDQHTDIQFVPFHTPASAVCATCAGVSASGSYLQYLKIKTIAATSTASYPVYLLQEEGRNQLVTIRIDLPDGRNITYSYDNSQMVDLTPVTNKFLDQSFIWIGWMNCISDDNCPSPDPEGTSFPAGTSYIIDTPDGIFTGSNVTAMRKLDYYMDLSPSSNSNLFTLYNPQFGVDCSHCDTNPSQTCCIPSYDQLNPPPTINADDWCALYGEAKVSPSRMQDSPHNYIRRTTVDPLTKIVSVVPNYIGSASVSTFPDGVIAQLLSKESIYGNLAGQPDVMDEVPIILSTQLFWEKQLTITFPGTLIAFEGYVDNLCPSQQQMYFQATSNSWITLNVLNSFPERSINVTIITSPINQTIDDSGIVTNCSLYKHVTITPGETYSLDLGTCDMQNIIVESYGQTLENDPTSYGFQTCWDYTGSLNAVYSSQYINSQPLPSSAANASQLAILAVQQSQEAITNLQSTDASFKFALYKQSYTTIYAQQQQVNIAQEMHDYIYNNLPLSNATDNNGTALLYLTTTQASQLTNLQQQMITINNQAQSAVSASSQELVNLEAMSQTLSSQLATNLNNTLQAAQTASTIQANYLLAQQQFNAVQANLSKDAEAHLADMEIITSQLAVVSNRLTIAANSPLYITPCPPGSCTAPATVDYGSAISAWDGFKQFCEGIGEIGEDVYDTMSNIVGLALSLLNPSCFLDLCNLWTYLQYIIIVIIVVLVLCCCCFGTQLFNTVKPTKKAPSQE